ncbi:hypothetical protein K7432_011542 [Basidiobolus ranarum]|uniref:Uncharacterized protein n=1 Tax=Basidiobolus ranarum TaxID=34480 RepID=A0ABR2VUH5_9FUNG
MRMWQISFGLSCLYLKNPDDELRNSVLGRYPSLRLAYSLLYTTTQVFHAVIPIIYWTVVMRTGFEYISVYQFWLSLSLHGGNLTLTLVEMCLSKMRLSWTHAPSLLLIVMLYFGLAWVYYAYTGDSAYMAISGYNTWSTLFVRYMLVLGIFAIIYIVVYYLHRIRTNLGESLMETDQNTDVVIIEVTKEEAITEPKPALCTSRSVLSPSSQAQTFGHVLTFF